jgi:aerobic-type carbon monoxide dehydrogenase small subunit (CoxS/CutS family)
MVTKPRTQNSEFTLLVNGERRVVRAAADEPLLWVLRDQLRLTGAKFGCGEGFCGACSVLVNGRAQRSCQLPVSRLASGQEIVTIEGLGQPGNLSPVQRAFAEHTAFGCGYCTPGQIVAATDLLCRNRRPTREQIVAAMDRNLCRCAAYPNILEAVESLASTPDPEEI